MIITLIVLLTTCRSTDRLRGNTRENLDSLDSGGADVVIIDCAEPGPVVLAAAYSPR